MAYRFSSQIRAPFDPSVTITVYALFADQRSGTLCIFHTVTGMPAIIDASVSFRVRISICFNKVSDKSCRSRIKNGSHMMRSRIARHVFYYGHWYLQLQQYDTGIRYGSNAVLISSI